MNVQERLKKALEVAQAQKKAQIQLHNATNESKKEILAVAFKEHLELFKHLNETYIRRYRGYTSISENKLCLPETAEKLFKRSGYTFFGVSVYIKWNELTPYIIHNWDKNEKPIYNMEESLEFHINRVTQAIMNNSKDMRNAGEIQYIKIGD